MTGAHHSATRAHGPAARALRGALLVPLVATFLVPVQSASAAEPATVVQPEAETAPIESAVDQIVVDVPAVEASGDLSTDGTAPEPSPTTGGDVAAEVVADEATADGLLETPVVETDEFALLGVTWPDGGDVTGLAPEVRVRTDGDWSEWIAVEPADDGPDAGTADAASSVRGGSEPLWVPGADAVQARFAATETGGPEDLRVELVQPGEGTSGASVTTSSGAGDAVVTTAGYRTAAATTAATSGALLAASSSAPQPSIVSRAGWGADESLRTYNAGCGTPEYSSGLVGAVVHHTANDNGSYGTPEQARALLRSIYAYHVRSRGWCDIGYNFVVDRWGYIYEGRAGGIDRPVKGVHAGGFNTGTVGVSMLGEFTSVGPSNEQRDAVARIIAWRLGAYGKAPQGRMQYHTLGGENSRFPAGTTVDLPVVFGHRDTAYTACPGNMGYAALDGIRARAQSLTSYTALIQALYIDLLGRGADPSGLQTWGDQLARGVSQAQLVATLTWSDEYIDRRVVQAYQTVLGRAPEPGGADHWRRVVRAGVVPLDDVPRYLMASPEMYAKGGGTDRGFVNVMYEQVLGRPAGAPEQAYWADQIPRAGREVVLTGIWVSYESARRRAAVYYRTFLGREPDPSGLETWTMILMGQGESAVRTGIAGSQEYLDRARSRF
ncbi:DUF4214 domain-containing protein [Cellulomonas sp. NPDC055163]